MNDIQRADLEADLRLWLDAMSTKSLRASQRFALAHGLVLSDLQALQLMSQADRAGDNRLTPGDLSRQLDLSSGAVTYLVDRLAKAGLATAQRDTGDRRRTRLSLTDEGRTLVRRHESGMQSVGRLAVMDICDEDIEATTKVLRRLSKAIDSYSERFDHD